MLLSSAEQLHYAIPTATDRNILRFYTPIVRAMEEYEINTFLRQAHFLGQITQESGSLHYTTEIASGKAYDNRKDLGNLDPEAVRAAKRHNSTPGQWFRGHGLIQLTGFYWHKKCGEALGKDFINEPYLLTLPEDAALSAAWFWYYTDCNEFADLDDSKRLTKRINGGLTHLDRRIKYTELAKLALKQTTF